MKKLFAALSMIAVAAALASPDEGQPSARLEGSLTTGMHCFVPLGDRSQRSEIYFFDNPLGGMNTPYQAIVGGRLVATGYGLAAHVSSGYNSIPSGSSVQNSFQLWDAYAWVNAGSFTFEAGQLDDFDFVSWVDRQSYLGRDRFGSAGLAAKYRSGSFAAILELPAYVPGALSNQCTRWNAAVDPGVGGLDGDALASFKSLYAAASYRATGLGGIQAGGQGQGTNAAGGWNGINLWFDVSYKGAERLISDFELELWNLGQEDPSGGSVDGLAYTASTVLGWGFDRFVLQSSFVLLQGDSSESDKYDLRVQPSVTLPLGGGTTAVLTGRVDNLAGGDYLSSQGAGKPSFWVDPELRINIGSNQVAVGAFFGNDYTGGDSAGGSWFFGNAAGSSPGFGGNSYSASSPRYFLDVYASLVFAF